MSQNERTLWSALKGYFNALPDREDEAETISQISSGVRFHGANLLGPHLCHLHASLGLNLNSTAVIIGAMLISPLMGPIIGMGLAIGINDFELLKTLDQELPRSDCDQRPHGDHLLRHLPAQRSAVRAPRTHLADAV